MCLKGKEKREKIKREKETSSQERERERRYVRNMAEGKDTKRKKRDKS
jgi:hypothetical protein